MKATIGRLKQPLVLETDNGVTVIPRGCIIEVSSEDDYPHTCTEQAIEESVEILNKQKT